MSDKKDCAFFEKICNGIGDILNSIKSEDLKRIYKESGMSPKEAKVSFAFGILSHVLSNIIVNLPKPPEIGREDKVKFYSFLIKNFTDTTWQFINESDSQIH